MARKRIIAGNWKMNNTKVTATKLLDEILPNIKNTKSEIVVCVPFTLLDVVSQKINNTNIKLGAQNIAWAESGAFTGEISAAMLKDSSTRYVVVGHSERRQYFGETDETVNKRTIATINAGMYPIVCVGETEAEKNDNKTNNIIKNQIKKAFAAIDENQIKQVVIAYEPVWAIGTGKTATAEDANETIKFIRSQIESLYNKNVSQNISILYGGSMNAKNASELLSMSDIDGGLIGGASLKAEDFATICNVN